MPAWPNEPVNDGEGVRLSAVRVVTSLLRDVQDGVVRASGAWRVELEALKRAQVELLVGGDAVPELSMVGELPPLVRSDMTQVFEPEFTPDVGGRLFAYLGRASAAEEQQAAIDEFAASRGFTLAAVFDEHSSPPDHRMPVVLGRETGLAFERALDEAWEHDGAVVLRRLSDIAGNLGGILHTLLVHRADDAYPPILTAHEGLDTSSAAGRILAEVIKRSYAQANASSSEAFQKELTLRALYRAQLGGDDQLLRDLIAGKPMLSFETWLELRAIKPE